KPRPRAGTISRVAWKRARARKAPPASACRPRARRRRPGWRATDATGAGARGEGAACVGMSGKIEAEIAVLPPEERAEYLAAIGLKEAGIDRLIRAGYGLLNLITYFTAGPKEAAAWPITG